MITPEELHEQIMEQIDLTKEVEDEELTRVIYEILRETEEQEYISLKEKLSSNIPHTIRNKLSPMLKRKMLFERKSSFSK